MIAARGPCGFPKTARLRRRAEFLRVQQGGRRRHGQDFVLLSLPNHLGGRRLGVTVSAKVGGAVMRNRVKRVVRDAFRRHGRTPAVPLDLVVIAKPSAAGRSNDELAKQVAELLRSV